MLHHLPEEEISSEGGKAKERPKQVSQQQPNNLHTRKNKDLLESKSLKFRKEDYIIPMR